MTSESVSSRVASTTIAYLYIVFAYAEYLVTFLNREVSSIGLGCACLQ
jgi:hypothetical protein